VMSNKRDLLVCNKIATLTESAYTLEVEQLNELLYHVETNENYCNANELLDLNRHKIIHKAHLILRATFEPDAFQFVFNRN
jgi:hypothetical protein